MRASLAIVCLMCVLCCTSAVEAQQQALRYVNGTIQLLSVSDSLGEQSREVSDQGTMFIERDSSVASSLEDHVSSFSYDTILEEHSFFDEHSSIPACISFASLNRPKVQLLPDAASSMMLRVPDPCTAVDRVLELRNNLQEPLTLSSLKFVSSAEMPNFTDSLQERAPSEAVGVLPAARFGVAPMRLPVTLAPGEALPIRIHLNARAAGTYVQQLVLGLETPSRVLDTAIAFGLTVENDLPFAFGVAVDSTHIGPITVCQSKDFRVHIANSLCDTMTLMSAKWYSTTKSFGFIENAPFPITLPPSSTLDENMRFAPAIAAEDSARLVLSFRYADKIHDTTLTFLGSARTNFHGFLGDSILNFDTVLHCDARQLTTYFHNASCDSVNVAQIVSVPLAGYSVVQPTKSVWVAVGDSIPVTILLNPTKSGVVDDYVELHVKTREGEDHEFDLAMHGFVRAPKHDIVFPTNMTLDSLTPCATIDTMLTIINRGICDTLTLKKVNLTGSSWFLLNYFTTDTKTLYVGDTIHIPLRIVLKPEGTAEADIRMEGENFDTAIHLKVSVRFGGRALNLVANDTILTSNLCQTDSATYLLVNPGCVDMQLDSLYLVGSTNDQTQFRFEHPISQPSIIRAGDELPIKVIFDPDGNGDGEVRLVVRSTGAGLSKDVLITGAVLGSKAVARIGLLAGKGELTESSKAGQEVTVSVIALDEIADTMNLDGLSVTLRFDDGLLTERTLLPSNGWDVQPVADTNGALRLRFSRTPGKTIAAGSEIAKVTFYTSLSDSNYSNVTLEQARFNPEDPSFERCKLSAFSADDTVRIDVSMFAGDQGDHDMNGDQPSIRGMAVFPNPIQSRPGKIAMAEVDFTLAEEGDVRMDLRDDLGKLVAVLLQGNLYAGKHYVPIALPLSAEGNYFLSIDAGGYRDVRKIIIRN